MLLAFPAALIDVAFPRYLDSCESRTRHYIVWMASCDYPCMSRAS